MSARSSAATKRSTTARWAAAGSACASGSTPSSLEPRPRALEGAVDARGRRVEQVGDARGGQVEHLAQDQRRPLAGREQLQRGHVRQAEPAALDGRRRRIGRERLQPRHLEVRDDRRLRVVEDRPDSGRERSALPALERVQAGVRRDPVQPRAERGSLGVVRVEGPPRPQHRLLDEVVGVMDRSQHPVAVHPQLMAMRLDRSFELHRLGGATRELDIGRLGVDADRRLLQAEQPRHGDHEQDAEDDADRPVAEAREQRTRRERRRWRRSRRRRSRCSRSARSRSRGDVMSASTAVPATKQPAQPSPSRKKNGVISGEAIRSRPCRTSRRAQTPSAIRSVRRRPRRSARMPTG